MNPLNAAIGAAVGWLWAGGDRMFHDPAEAKINSVLSRGRAIKAQAKRQRRDDLEHALLLLLLPRFGAQRSRGLARKASRLACRGY